MSEQPANDRIFQLEMANRMLRLENEKLRAIMLDLVVFGSAAIDLEADDEDHENAAAVLEASIKQARTLLGLVRPEPLS